MLKIIKRPHFTRLGERDRRLYLGERERLLDREYDRERERRRLLRLLTKSRESFVFCCKPFTMAFVFGMN